MNFPNPLNWLKNKIEEAPAEGVSSGFPIPYPSEVPQEYSATIRIKKEKERKLSTDEKLSLAVEREVEFLKGCVCA